MKRLLLLARHAQRALAALPALPARLALPALAALLSLLALPAPPLLAQAPAAATTQAIAPAAAAAAAGATALDPATNITAGEIEGHIDVLASDLFEGREAGSRGERRAAAYIVGQLEECERLQPAGVDGGWFQPFPLHVRKHGSPLDADGDDDSKDDGRDAEPLTEARNIIAKLPGTDPKLAAQFIVLGAHYDHVGFGEHGNALDAPGEIHNGADDNASGSATLLDLATSLANAGWQPRRTILFQWYSGEELGLLGSEYYVDHPLYPLDQTVFMLNMDMVGRLVGRTLVVGGTGTSPGIAAVAEDLCKPLHLTMIDDPPGTDPSDNTSFYLHDIPAIFLFTGLHEDYHRATDDSWKINAPGAADVGKLAAGILEAVDARDARLAFAKAPGNGLMFTPRPYIGATFRPAPPTGPPGAALSVLLPGSPAEHAGLQSGDVITALDGQPVTDIGALETALRHVSTDLPPVRFSLWRELPPTEPQQAAPGTSLSTVTWQPLEITVQPIIK